MSKDWTGSQKSIFRTLGSSHHSETEREVNDYYATDPKAAEMLLGLETFNSNILEPACGQGHLSKVFSEKGYNVTSSDLIDRGFGTSGVDFLQMKNWHGDIVTNPPYKYAREFVLHALKIIPKGNKVAMFLKIQFVEGKGRKSLFLVLPPIRIWQSSSRINCALNGDFDGLRTSGGSAVAYAWFIWEKGFEGHTTLRWFN